MLPAMALFQEQLDARVSSFTADITSILRRAVERAVSDALLVSKTHRPRAKSSSTASPAAKRPKSGRGSSLDTETVLREVKRKGGRRVEEIAKSLRTSTKSLALPLRKLIAANKVKTRGNRRGTRY